jgi:mannose-6-phosphate isomerase
MPDLAPLPPFLLLEPEYRDYVWGGQRLRPHVGLTAEAWVVFEGDKVSNGPCQGARLAELAGQHGAALLGEKTVRQTGRRFPLLVKLLDCAQWLSLQVHPDDTQAEQIEGAGHFGKTEAWHVLEASPGAQIIAGVKPRVTGEALAEAIRNGTVERLSQYLTLQTGDTVFMRPGTLHALGPGLLIYEVQQTSDLTYRVYDWGRPQTQKRRLHIEQALKVTRNDARVEPLPLPSLLDGEQTTLCTSDYFSLAMLNSTSIPIALDTDGKSFHALTVIEGKVGLLAKGDCLELSRFDTVLIPAATGSYLLEPIGAFRALKASVD